MFPWSVSFPYQLGMASLPASTLGATTGIPAGNPTPIVSNHTGDESPAFEIISITLFGISCIVVTFRIFARLRARSKRLASKGVGADEYFGIAALVLAGGVTGNIIAGVHYGINEQRKNQDVFELNHQLKNFLAFVIICTLCLGALKMSVLCLYLRMTPLRNHRWTIYGIMILVDAHLIVAILGSLFRCSPISSYWDVAKFLRGPAECMNILYFDIFNSAWTAFWDIVICLLPIPIIHRLRASPGKKFGLYLVVAFSGLSIVCAITRLVSLIVLTNLQPVDVSWNSPVIPFVSALEAYIALITSSFPAIYPLLVKPRWNSRKTETPIPPPPPPPPPSDELWRSDVDTMAPSSVRANNNNFLKWNFQMGEARATVRAVSAGSESINMVNNLQRIGRFSRRCLPSLREPSSSVSPLGSRNNSTIPEAEIARDELVKEEGTPASAGPSDRP